MIFRSCLCWLNQQDLHVSLDVCSSATGVSEVGVSSSIQVIQECEGVVLIYQTETVTEWINHVNLTGHPSYTGTPPTSSSPFLIHISIFTLLIPWLGPTTLKERWDWACLFRHTPKHFVRISDTLVYEDSP